MMVVPKKIESVSNISISGPAVTKGCLMEVRGAQNIHSLGD